jgi:DNA-directed RNA polymerase subunit RPC12/RpoP
VSANVETHSNNDTIACPHCSETLTDIYEGFDAQDEDIDFDCGHCGKTFRLSRRVTVYYTARATVVP